MDAYWGYVLPKSTQLVSGSTQAHPGLWDGKAPQLYAICPLFSVPLAGGGCGLKFQEEETGPLPRAPPILANERWPQGYDLTPTPFLGQSAEFHLEHMAFKL